MGLESAPLSPAVCLSLLENQTGLWCGLGTGVCLSVHIINLLTVVPGTVLLGSTSGLPDTAWPRLGLAQANRQTVYGGTSPCFGIGGRG